MDMPKNHYNSAYVVDVSYERKDYFERNLSSMVSELTEPD